MKTFKRMMLRFFFVMEVCVFTGVYLFGPNGLQTMVRLNKENSCLVNEISDLQVQLSDWDQKIALWQSDDFYKEKIAREQLQMARKGDEVFYLK